MKNTSLLLVFLTFHFTLTAQTLSTQDTTYIKNAKAGETALKAGDYETCLQVFQTAFEIKQTSYLSTMRAAACAYKANDEVLLEQYLDKAFEINWGGSKEVFANYSEFTFLQGSDFAQMIEERYMKTARDLGVNLDLMNELAVMRKTDQEHRMQMGPISKKYGWESPQMDSLLKIQTYVDSVNTARVEEMIAEYGYPGKSLVGENQSSTAFLVIQHADRSIQEKYLSLITKAADDGEVKWNYVALLVDRVRTGNGQKQIYGSQYTRDQETGKFYFFPIENPHKIDSTRATVGLGPFQKYAERSNIQWDADAHIAFHKELAEKQKQEEEKK